MIVKGPPFVVVTFALIAKFVPVREIPDAPFVSRAPLNVVDPVPALCKIEVAVIALAMRFPVEVIVKAPRRGEAPTAPTREITPPVPALRVKFPGPFTAPEKVILAPAAVPPAFVVSTEALPVKVTVLLKLTIPPGVRSVELPELNVVAAKFIPAAAAVVRIVPKMLVAPTVWVNPFVNVRLGEPPLLRVTAPVLEKVVAGVIVPPLLKMTP